MLNNIDSKKIAYLIGFMAGDGGFNSGFGKRVDRMAVTTTDEDIVIWIDKNIGEFTMHNPKFNDNKSMGVIARQASYTKIFNTKHSEFFKKYGILCKKTDRTIQNISKKDMKFYMLGLLDSDGCISYTLRKDRDRVVCRVSFTHPSYELLSKVQTYLTDELDISSSIKPKGIEKCLVLSFSKVSSVEKFCYWIYSEESDVVLKRKLYVWKELQGVLTEKRDTGTCLPREFIDTPEYHAIVGQGGKYMYIVNGVEYPIVSMAAKAAGVDNKIILSRCRQYNFGCSLRPKTETEIKETAVYIKRQIKKLYEVWKESN